MKSHRFLAGKKAGILVFTLWLVAAAMTPALVRSSGVPAEDCWMSIFQGDQKIGHSHLVLTPRQNGYRLSEEALLAVNLLGQTQQIIMSTHARLKTDLTISFFEFSMESGAFSFSAKGENKGGVIRMTLNAGGLEQSVDLPIDGPPFLAASVADALILAPLKKGESRVFHILDPASVGFVPAKLTFDGPDEVLIAGKKIKARRYSMLFRGALQQAWMDKKGRRLMETGIAGLTALRTDKKTATAPWDPASSMDLAGLAAVDAGRLSLPPEEIRVLEAKISGIDGLHLDLDGGRQKFENGRIIVYKESLEGVNSVTDKDLDQEDVRPFLRPSLFIQSGHPKIAALAKAIVDETDLPFARLLKIMDWMNAEVKQQPVASRPDALSTLENKVGDCNEHAMLMAALLRACRIPAKVESGLVYLAGRFYYHAWDSVFLGKWITVDPVFGQVPADATHIRLSVGDTDMGLDLMGAIGKLRLSIVEAVGQQDPTATGKSP